MSNRNHYQVSPFLNDDEMIEEEILKNSNIGRVHNKNSHNSSEDLYKQQTIGINSPNSNSGYHYPIPPQYHHSPPFDVFKHHINQDETDNTVGVRMNLQVNEGDPLKRSISPIYINPSPQRRTHKRSSSHNPPSKSFLYSHHSPPTNTNQYLSPPYIKSPNLNQQPSSTTTTTTTTTTTSNGSGSGSGSGNSNKNITWSPAATKKKSSLKTSLDPSIFLPPTSSISHGSSPIDGRSPPLSPRGITISGGGNIPNSNNINITSPQSASSTPNHRRGISWEPSIQGKSPTFETLNQIIREKKDAILQRERELLMKQKILESQLSSSPPSNSSNTPSINIPNININSGGQINQSSPPSSNSFLSVNQPHRVLKHNRSKSDTTTILKLHNAINKNKPPPPPQQQHIHPSSPINNFIFINEQPPSQFSNTSTTTTTTTTILNPMTSSKKPPASSSISSNALGDGNKSPSYQKLYLNNVTSPRMVLEQQLKHQEKLKRRKSVDPNILIHQQQQQHLYPSHNYNPHQQQYLYQQQQYHTPNLTSATNKLKNSTYNIQQLLSSLKSLDLDEFEEEIDKEIQQVILQTKNIQGKVDLLERVRCTAPDPLLMLFGENYNQSLVNNKNNSNNNNGNNIKNNDGNNQNNYFDQNNNNNIQSSNSTGGKSKYMKSNFVSSPHLYQNNVYYPSSEHIQLDEGYSNNQVTRCPDKSKSKNLNSLPRSSAFSPPPRIN